MKKQVNLGVTIALMAVSAMLAFVITAISYQQMVNASLSTSFAREKAFSRLFELDKIVRKNYVGEIDEEKLMEGILTGYMEGLGDKYGMYMCAETYESFMESMDGKFQGIGVRVIKDTQTGYIKIVNVMKDSPAQKNQVQVGDYIVKVDGKDVAEIGYYDAVNALLGEEGTVAKFTVAVGGDFENLKDYEILRETFQMNSVEYRMLADKIGYVKISEFNNTTFAEFETAISNLTNSGAVGVVFDVRGNLGGELNAICNVLDKLLPEGPIIRIVDKDGNEETRNSDANELELPMAVLINGETYSAAELFAAALRDYEKATLVGTTTYGKGTMQSIIELTENAAVDLSVKMYNPPKGENYEGVGVAPDVEVALTPELEQRFYELTDEEDIQLQKALEVVQEAVQAAAAS